MDKQHRSVSIIIPTKNRPGDLEAAIESVLRQTVMPEELVIIDQSETDESAGRVSSLLTGHDGVIVPKLRYLRDTQISGLAQARNRSMQIATCEIWVFLDDDVYLEPQFLQELLAVYDDHPNATGVSGIITNYEAPARIFRYWSALFVRGPFFDDRQPIYWNAQLLQRCTPIRVSRLGGGLMSFRADRVRNVRFDENLRGVSDGEDVDFTTRLGSDSELFIAPRARLVHNQSPIGRMRDHWLRRNAKATTYLFYKLWADRLINRCWYYWLNAGYAVVAALAILKRRDCEPWRAFRAGLREAMEAVGPHRASL